MTVSKYSEAVRQLLEAELKCPDCGAENTVGDGGAHITVDADGLAICRCCLNDWRPQVEPS